MRLRFHPEARAELTDARGWYAERNIVAAEQFVDEVLGMVESVLDAPERWDWDAMACAESRFVGSRSRSSTATHWAQSWSRS